MSWIFNQKLFIFISLAVCVIGAQAGTRMQETESSVPELTAFHEIIYPIWHTAYPDKDYAALRGYAPEVKSLAGKIFAAKLPPILHEKQAKWDQGLAELKKAVEDYLAAAAGGDDGALLKAAESLHSKYEMMVRTIRPVLKEVDAFHKVLYVVYHKYLPNKDHESINSVSEDLTLKAEAITKATLPKRLEPKTEAFKTAAGALHEATVALAGTLKSGRGSAIEAAVEAVHTRYQALEKIFD
jgi:hypothetical protein